MRISSVTELNLSSNGRRVSWENLSVCLSTCVTKECKEVSRISRRFVNFEESRAITGPHCEKEKRDITIEALEALGYYNRSKTLSRRSGLMYKMFKINYAEDKYPNPVLSLYGSFSNATVAVRSRTMVATLRILCNKLKFLGGTENGT